MNARTATGADLPVGQRRSSIPSLAMRLLVALIFGGLTFGATALADQSTTTTVILSVFIGGLVLVVQYLADFERRLTATVDEQTQLLRQLSDATRLEGKIRESPLAMDDVFNLVQTVTTIHSVGIRPIAELVMDEWNRLNRFTQQLGAGETRYDGEDREWLLALTERAQGHIMATSSMSVDDGFWDTELGGRYVDIQGAAVERGVRVRRIFMLDSTQSVDQAVVDAWRKTQQEKNIDVRFLFADDLTQAQRALYKDYVLFDKRVYYQVRPPERRWASDQTGAAVVETMLSTKRSDVEFGDDYFEELWQLAETVASPAPAVNPATPSPNRATP